MRSPISILVSGGGLAITRILVGLVRSKWIATFLGLEGIGLLAQATQFQTILCSAASFSAAAALIQGSKGIYRERELELFRCAIALIIFGFTLAVSAVFLIGPSHITQWLFGPGHSSVELALVMISVPFLLISSTYIESLFFINDRFDRYSINSAIHSVLQALGFMALVYYFGTRGLMLAIPLSAMILALIFYGDLARLGLLRWRAFIPKWNKELAKFLVSFGTALFFIGVGGSFIQLSVRSLLVARMGLSENGILQVPVALSAYGGAIVTNFVWGRIHPHFSAPERRDPFELTIAVMSSFIVALGTWAMVPALIPIFYSKAFNSALPLVGLQCAGDVLYFSFFTASIALLAMGQLKTYVLGWMLYYLPFAGFLCFPSHLGSRQYFYVHFLSSGVALAAMLLLGARKHLFSTADSARLGLLSAGLVAIMACLAYFDPHWLVGRIALAGICLLLAIVLWHLFYGAAVRSQLMDVSKWLRHRLNLFSAKQAN